MQAYAAMLAERGYTVLDIDMQPPKDNSDPEEALTHFEKGICFSSCFRFREI
jgi:hypothetical protein